MMILETDEERIAFEFICSYAGEGFSKLSQAIKLKIKETTMLGDNIKIVAEQDTLCIKNI